MGDTFRASKLIRFQHCDPAGIVFYPQYFVLFHEVIEDWFYNGLQLKFAELIVEKRLGAPTVDIRAAHAKADHIQNKERIVLYSRGTHCGAERNRCCKHGRAEHVLVLAERPPISEEKRRPGPALLDGFAGSGWMGKYAVLRHDFVLASRSEGRARLHVVIARRMVRTIGRTTD